MSDSKKVVVLYHADCEDGFGSAWAAWKRFGARARYVPVKRGEPLPDGLKNKTVYCLDFVYREKLQRDLKKIVRRLVCIDHHISSQREVTLADEYVFNIRHSGAVLAWQYFYKHKPVPLLLSYVEDTDLWEFRLPSSRAVFAYINFNKPSFKIWNRLSKEIATKKRDFLKKGALILANEERLIKEVSEKSYLVSFGGKRVLAVNSPLFRSELGNLLTKKRPPLAIVWYNRDGNTARISLRSVGRCDAAKIAEKYGGGGHKHAAMFLAPANNLPWKTKN